MTISAGSLDRLIQLQHGTATADPESNEPIKTWATYATLWAKQDFFGSDEGEDAAREFADYGLYFTFRWRSDVNAEDRILHKIDGTNYETFEVLGRGREIGRRRWLRVKVRLVE